MARRDRRFLALVLLLPLFAVKSESLWIDEANSAYKAMQPTITSWWHTLLSEQGSDLQMPFYMLCLWGWEKIAGSSEIALRLANIPLLYLGQFALYRVSARQNHTALVVLFVAGINPFLWFYLNEARPYLMQYAGACLTVCALSEASDRHRYGWFLAFGLLLLGGSSLLGMIWAASALATVAVILLRTGTLTSVGRELKPLAFTLVSLAVLIGYYGWTLFLGARASAAGQTVGTNLLFILFELFGFAGLGPGRLEIRQSGFDSFQNFLLPLVLSGVALAIVLVGSLRVIARPIHREKVIAAIVYTSAATSVLTLAGLATHFRLLGRHFMPLCPLIIVLVATSLHYLWQTRWRFAAALVALTWLNSALLLRFAPRHRKDDYRAAAALASASLKDSRIVWWAADRAGARYYQLPIDQPPTNLHLLINPMIDSLHQLPQPDLIVLSKPDLYDDRHGIRSYLESENFVQNKSLPAFTIWRPSHPTP